MTEPTVWVVAGCLFEVSLPAEPGGWRWDGPTPDVTLLAEDVRDGRHHFRFRAEAAGARTGAARLHFRRHAGGAERAVVVRVAPERHPGGRR